MLNCELLIFFEPECQNGDDILIWTHDDLRFYSQSPEMVCTVCTNYCEFENTAVFSQTVVFFRYSCAPVALFSAPVTKYVGENFLPIKVS